MYLDGEVYKNHHHFHNEIQHKITQVSFEKLQHLENESAPHNKKIQAHLKLTSCSNAKPRSNEGPMSDTREIFSKDIELENWYGCLCGSDDIKDGWIQCNICTRWCHLSCAEYSVDEDKRYVCPKYPRCSRDFNQTAEIV